ncbi:hypothetical protein [Catellatospora sichuanensis]|uniref:hypothetical protein n=1 Tax=Catellatospora sichuanensis TaxID=1969805 RepID=UPI0011844A85|nr:hypothetical protein [Catellatospora sichuanensis]
MLTAARPDTTGRMPLTAHIPGINQLRPPTDTVPRVIPPGTPPQPPFSPWSGHGRTANVAALPTAVGVGRRRRWPWVLAVLTVLSLGCCGVLTVVTEPIRDQYPVRAVLGAEVAGLRKDTSPQLQALEQELIDDIHAERGEYADAIGVKLDDPKAEKKVVFLVVVTALVLDPESELDKVMAMVGDGVLRNAQAYDARPRGGVLKCADIYDKGGRDAVACGWMDYGSFGIAVFYGGRPKDDSAQLLYTIRTEILVKA